jgi:hypothetical protein
MMTSMDQNGVITIDERQPRMEPWGLFWPEQHAEICKAAERVTRQQRRHLERQRRKAR